MLVLAATAAIGLDNAWTFPSDLGYDALAHRTYADLLIHHGRNPEPGRVAGVPHAAGLLCNRGLR